MGGEENFFSNFRINFHLIILFNKFENLIFLLKFLFYLLKFKI